MAIPIAILKEIKAGLRDIIINSTDSNSREKALDLLLFMECKSFLPVNIDNYFIPADIYIETIKYMAEDKKIKAIKTIKSGIGISLKEAKELVEKISFVEEISCAKGYVDINPDS